MITKIFNLKIISNILKTYLKKIITLYALRPNNVAHCHFIQLHSLETETPKKIEMRSISNKLRQSIWQYLHPVANRSSYIRIPPSFLLKKIVKSLFRLFLQSPHIQVRTTTKGMGILDLLSTWFLFHLFYFNVMFWFYFVNLVSWDSH